MARSRETKIELTAYDDLFQTDESREEAKLSKIRDIPISEIDEFPDHPFKVLMDEDMEQLVESIKRNGVMTPATVRLKEDGRYELISGHRRKKACELAGLETLKCEVKELTRDEAIIVMVESNLQRSVILPSEKAFAYKVLSFIMIMSVYGRFFKLYIYTAIAPVPLSAFAGEPSQSVGKSFIKSYAAVCLEGAVIVLACIIFSLFASSPPVVNPDAAAVTMVWSYIGELVFNMLVLVGAVKMADRVVREMMGL